MNYWPALSANLAETLDPLTAHGAGPRGHRRPHGARDVRRAAAGWRTTTPTSGARPPPSTARSGACGRPAARGCALHALGTLRVRPRSRVSARPSTRCSRAPPQFFLDTLVEDPTGTVARDVPVAVAREPASARHVAAIGPTMDQQILRDLFASVSEAARVLDVDRELQRAVGEDPCPAGADADRRRGTAPGVAGGLGHAGARDAASARVASLRPVSRPRHRRPADTRRWPRRSNARSRSEATRPPAGPRRGASTSGRAWATATMRTRS